MNCAGINATNYFLKIGGDQVHSIGHFLKHPISESLSIQISYLSQGGPLSGLDFSLYMNKLLE